LGLGPWEPFRSTEILDIHSFTYDRKTGWIIQERVKKFQHKGAPLSVVTQVPVTGDVREDPVETTREGFAFMDATVDNIQRLCQQNEEKEMRIKELEEKLQQVKIDERSLLNFKANVEKVRNELEGAIIDMYANLHLFQNVVATIIEQNDWIQMQLTQYNTIREGITDIDTWIAENPDAPPWSYTDPRNQQGRQICMR
jgi:small-conductance mechanosensitive channel